MAKKMTKKRKTPTRPKDYNVVSFIIPSVGKDNKMQVGEFEAIVHSLYINKYGNQIGALVELEGGGSLSLDLESFDYYLSPKSVS
jgi:hypothetical protein